MKKVLIIVDMQNDFVTGSLGTKEAQNIVPNIKKKIKEYLDCGESVAFTQDTHFEDYFETNEGRNLPVEHCRFKTEGWKICPELDIPDLPHYTKDTFGYEYWKEAFPEDIKEIELCGVCTDICVVSNALVLKMLYPETNIVVDASCCAGVTPEKHKAAMEVMKSCQIVVIDE